MPGIHIHESFPPLAHDVPTGSTMHNMPAAHSTGGVHIERGGSQPLPVAAHAPVDAGPGHSVLRLRGGGGDDAATPQSKLDKKKAELLELDGKLAELQRRGTEARNKFRQLLRDKASGQALIDASREGTNLRRESDSLVKARKGVELDILDLERALENARSGSHKA
jgi:hypothetical protein